MKLNLNPIGYILECNGFGFFVVPQIHHNAPFRKSNDVSTNSSITLMLLMQNQRFIDKIVHFFPLFHFFHFFFYKLPFFRPNYDFLLYFFENEKTI